MKFISSDKKTTIYGKIWQPKNKAVGMIQLVHGITEHIGRYEDVATYFTKRGFIVFGIDVIGHGKSLYAGKIKGYFGKEGSFQNVVDDVYQSYLIMTKKYPDLPCYMIGFSMGSFITRMILIEKNKELDLKGCFLLGTGTQPLLVLKIIRFIVKQHGKKIGEENYSKLIDSLAFDNYNKKFPDPQSNIDWLLANKKERNIYLNDALCLKHVSAGLFRELLSGMIFCCRKDHKIKIDFPIYLLSGKIDAVGDFGKGVVKTVVLMKKQGVENIEYVLFDNMRHDILHEEHCDDVLTCIVECISKDRGKYES